MPTNASCAPWRETMIRGAKAKRRCRILLSSNSEDPVGGLPRATWHEALNPYKNRGKPRRNGHACGRQYLRSATARLDLTRQASELSPAEAVRVGSLRARVRSSRRCG